MCGRYQRRSDKQRIAEAFALGSLDGLALEFAPDYNVAPQTMQPVIIWDRDFGTRSLQMMFWRFLPRFVNDPKPRESGGRFAVHDGIPGDGGGKGDAR